MKNTQPHAVFAYVHHNRRVASLVTVKADTDFSLRTDVLREFGQSIAMHVAAMGNFDVNSDWIFDSTKKVGDILNEIRMKLGENVVVDQVHVQGS